MKSSVVGFATAFDAAARPQETLQKAAVMADKLDWPCHGVLIVPEGYQGPTLWEGCNLQTLTIIRVADIPSVNNRQFFDALATRLADHIDLASALIILGSDNFGEALGVHLGVLWSASFVGRVNHIQANDSAWLGLERPVWGERLNQTLELTAGPAMLWYQSDEVLECEGHTGVVHDRTISFAAEEMNETALPLEERLPPIDTVSLVLSGGRSVTEPGFECLSAIAETLGGSVSGSLPAVDNGMVHAHRQVGVSGKYISPKMYVAVGISGTAQHMAGIAPSTVIVAVNKDPEAAIFRFADYGVVADWTTFLPLLQERVAELA